MLYFIIYGVDVLLSIQILVKVTILLLGFLILSSILSGFMLLSEDLKELPIVNLFAKPPFIITFFVLIILNVLIPSQKTLYTLAGVYVGVQLMENPQTNELLNKSYKVINKKLDSLIEDSEKLKE